MSSTFTYQPAVAERTVGIQYARPPHPQAKGVLEQMTTRGVPVSKTRLHIIQDGIASSELLNERNQLVELVKGDLGIFAHCARNMRALTEETHHAIDPFRELRVLEDEKIRKLFSVSDHAISTHVLSRANGIQASQMQQSLTSVTAAEMLAPKVGVSEDLAYSTAALHHFGLSLLAWNYPEVFSRVLSRHRREGTDIDTLTSKMIGIDAYEIGEIFGRRWGFQPEVLLALRNGANHKALHAIRDGKLPTLTELCELADLYAEAKDLKHFPEAEAKWKAAQSSLPELFSTNSCQEIDQRIKGALTSVVSEVPALCKLSTVRVIIPDLGQDTKKSSRPINPFISRCPPHIAQELSAAYEKIESKKLSLDAIRLLVERVVPMCGFTAGCLYLLNRSSIFEPALRVGALPLSSYKSYPLNGNNDISRSFFGSCPSRLANSRSDGEISDEIQGVLANGDYPGVLCLEVGPELSDDVDRNPMSLFQAILRTFGDALGRSSNS